MVVAVSRRWLVVGHGSVGSVLTQRILASGGMVSVFDTSPRIPVPSAERLVLLEAGTRPSVDYVVLCVPADVAVEAVAYFRSTIDDRPTVFDWTSSSPAAKRAVAIDGPGTWVDVALMDSLDKAARRPLLAVSGEAASRTAGALESVGFDVMVVGDQVGEAAAVKLVRSLFMKSLEILVIEARAVGTYLDPSGRPGPRWDAASAEEFASFADLLVESNVAHAVRRGGEIREAIALAAAGGCRPVMAAAAATVFDDLARQWGDTRPSPGAPVAELLSHALPVFQSTAPTR